MHRLFRTCWRRNINRKLLKTCFKVYKVTYSRSYREISWNDGVSNNTNAHDSSSSSATWPMSITKLGTGILVKRKDKQTLLPNSWINPIRTLLIGRTRFANLRYISCVHFASIFFRWSNIWRRYYKEIGDVLPDFSKIQAWKIFANSFVKIRERICECFQWVLSFQVAYLSIAYASSYAIVFPGRCIKKDAR